MNFVMAFLASIGNKLRITKTPDTIDMIKFWSSLILKLSKEFETILKRMIFLSKIELTKY
jgi:hypothetical protein